MDDACTELFRAMGIIFDPGGGLWLESQRLSGSFVVGSYSCRIDRPSSFDDVLDLRIFVQERRKKVVVFRGELFNERGGRVAAGEITYVYVGRGGRAVEMPNGLVRRLDGGLKG